MKKHTMTKAVSKLKLEDGDTLVVQIKDKQCEIEDAHCLKTQLQELYPNNTVIVTVGYELKFSILSSQYKVVPRDEVYLNLNDPKLGDKNEQSN